MGVLGIHVLALDAALLYRTRQRHEYLPSLGRRRLVPEGMSCRFLLCWLTASVAFQAKCVPCSNGARYSHRLQQSSRNPLILALLSAYSQSWRCSEPHLIRRWAAYMAKSVLALLQPNATVFPGQLATPSTYICQSSPANTLMARYPTFHREAGAELVLARRESSVVGSVAVEILPFRWQQYVSSERTCVGGLFQLSNRWRADRCSSRAINHQVASPFQVPRSSTYSSFATFLLLGNLALPVPAPVPFRPSPLPFPSASASISPPSSPSPSVNTKSPLAPMPSLPASSIKIPNASSAVSSMLRSSIVRDRANACGPRRCAIAS